MRYNTHIYFIKSSFTAQNKPQRAVNVLLTRLFRSVASSSAIEIGEKIEIIEKRLLKKYLSASCNTLQS